jgi:hypothetical protein
VVNLSRLSCDQNEYLLSPNARNRIKFPVNLPIRTNGCSNAQNIGKLYVFSDHFRRAKPASLVCLSLGDPSEEFVRGFTGKSGSLQHSWTGSIVLFEGFIPAINLR